jgi:acetate kinase
MRILVVNAGSSSVKLRVVGDGDATVHALDLPALDVGVESDAGDAGEAGTSIVLRSAIEGLGPVDAVGHRIVHGATRYREAIRVDGEVVEHLASLSDLAPLHQPGSVAALRAAMQALPAAPHVACFDTAFHATIPDAAATYALPGAWRERWPIRRFGFHGLSHAWAARRGAELVGRPLDKVRVVTAHLGAGASLAAVSGGRSIDTTMGFTPLEGLVMATRAGSVDPGLVLWLQRHGGLTADEVARGLEHASGILGLGETADMRDLLAAVEGGSAAARLARDVYVHRLRAGIAAMTAALGGLDALVFTGGVGENAPAIRALAVDGLGFLGLRLDRDRNERGTQDRDIGAAGTPAATLVVASREDLEIARQVRSAVGTTGSRGPGIGKAPGVPEDGSPRTS